jgi:predicted Zn-dependent protease
MKALPFKRTAWSCAGIAFLLAVLAAGAQSAGAFSLGDIINNAGKAVKIGKSAVKVGKVAIKAAEDITPEQEYYIGRAVAASILAKYRPWNNQKANQYVNELGQTLALASTKPQVFGGYHFLVLDSDEINAFGCPGGLILVTRGLLQCCKTEDEVAAVLAHEIGHVALQHGLGAIKSSRYTELGKVAALEGASHAGGNVAALSQTFGNSVGDITKTLLVSGYSRSQETDADEAAAKTISALGYDPEALIRVLKNMKTRLKPEGLDFAKTHPDPDDRIGDVAEACSAIEPPQAPPPPARQARYVAALKGV